MSSIFDFTKPGPGIEKDSPQKKGIHVYFELLWNKSGKLILANMMYFLIGIPIFLLYYILIFRFISNISIEGYQSSSYAHLALILALILSTFWGLGPITSGYKYILRNSAREDHFWLVNDFFKKTKENFKYTFIIFAVDIIQLAIAPQAIMTYWTLAKSGNMFYTFVTAFLLIFVIIYTIIHFYIFELTVTFKMNFIELCKYSFVLSLANIPACIFFIALIITSSFLIMGKFTAILIVFLSAFFWHSFFRFAIDLMELFNETEKPLDRLIDGYSNTAVFRSIAFIGDSLSSGEFETCNEDGTHNYHDLYEYSWGQYIARKNGLLAYNFSRGGMTAKEYVESFAQENGFWDKEKATQAYVIALGVNDIYNQNGEIGSIEDIDENDWRNNKKTFVGYYAAIIKRYKEISPDAKFFFVTFPNSNTPERDDKTLGMIKALYDIAEYFDNSYVIDLYRYGPVYDEKFEKKYFLYGHMTPEGYILTARIIDSYIDYIVRHNYDDFKTAGFIGTKIKYK